MKINKSLLNQILPTINLSIKKIPSSYIEDDWTLLESLDDVIDIKKKDVLITSTDSNNLSLSDKLKTFKNNNPDVADSDILDMIVPHSSKKHETIENQTTNNLPNKDLNTEHLAVKVFNFFKALSSSQPVDLEFQGFIDKQIILLKNFIFKEQNKSSNRDLLLTQTKFSDGQLLELETLLNQYYQSSDEFYFDRFFSLSKTEKEFIDKSIQGLKNVPILINGMFNLNYIKQISNELSQSNDVTLKTHTKMQYDFAKRNLSDNIKILSPTDAVAKNNYSFILNILKKHDRLVNKEIDLENNYLREDEYHFIELTQSLIENGKMISFLPSDLISEERSVFLDKVNMLNLKHIGFRLPLKENKLAEDLIITSNVQDQENKPLAVDNLYALNGQKLKDINSEKQNVFSELGFNKYLNYSIDTYQEDEITPVDIFEFSQELSVPNKLLNNTDKQYIEDTFYLIEKNQAAVYQNNKMTALKKGVNNNRAIAFIKLKEAFQTALSIQKTTDDKQSIEQSLKSLNIAYTEFKDKFGYLNLRKNERPLMIDSIYSNMSVLLEIPVTNQEGEVYYTQSDLFEKPVLEPIKKPDTPIELAQYYFEQTGDFQLETIAKELNEDIDYLKELLIDNSIAFLDGQKLIHRDIYLSGNILEKLKQAKILAQDNDNYRHNIYALEAVMPKSISFDDIHFEIGSFWLKEDMINQFLSSITGKQTVVKKNPMTQKWFIPQNSFNILSKDAQFNTQFGFEQKKATAILLAALNQLPTIIRNKGKIDIESTEIFKAKVNEIKQAFKSYMGESEKNKQDIFQTYNRIFNAYHKTDFKAKFKTIDGVNKNIQLRPHQLDNAQKAIHIGSGLLAHDAGSGKTYTQVLSAMLYSKINQAPTILTVPNHLPKQMVREALTLFPEANILFLDNDLLKDHDGLIRKINSQKYDIFVVKHDSINRYLTAPDEFVKQRLLQQKHKMVSLLNYLEGDINLSKELETGINQINKSLYKLETSNKLSIEKLGAKAIIVDESHNFKNLSIPEPTGNMLDQIVGSDRAQSLKMMIEYIQYSNQDKGEDYGVVFASGTPISNSLLETYNIQRYLQPTLLKKIGLDSIKNWSDTFLDIQITYEPDETGQNMIAKNKYVLKNIPELITLMNNVMSVVTIKDANLKVPDAQNIYEVCKMNEKQEEVLKDLIKRLDKIKNKKVPYYVDNKLKLISDSRKMALSPGLIRDSEGNTGELILTPKIEKLCENVVEGYQSTQDILGTQLVFCDLGTPSGFPKGDSVYDLIKQELMKKGLPEDEVAFIHDCKNPKEEEILAQNFRKGRIRVLIGSTRKMGEGKNFQDKVKYLHNLDYSWKATDMIQRRRRAERQGNINKDIKIFFYSTQNSFDAYILAKLDNKNKVFNYLLSGKEVSRSFELDIDPSFAEVYAAIMGKENFIKASKLETQLIQLTTQKRVLTKQFEHLTTQLEMQTKQLVEVKERLNKIDKIEQNPDIEKGWVINNEPTTRAEVLKRRQESIFYNQAKVSFNAESKRWLLSDLNVVGGFEFKRPVDIEKQYTNKTLMEKETLDNIKQLSDNITVIQKELNKIDLLEYDQDIQKLKLEYEELKSQIELEAEKQHTNNNEMMIN